MRIAVTGRFRAGQHPPSSTRNRPPPSRHPHDVTAAGMALSSPTGHPTRQALGHPARRTHRVPGADPHRREQSSAKHTPPPSVTMRRSSTATNTTGRNGYWHTDSRRRPTITRRRGLERHDASIQPAIAVTPTEPHSRGTRDVQRNELTTSHLRQHPEHHTQAVITRLTRSRTRC